MGERHQGVKCEKDVLASTNSDFMPEECSGDRKGTRRGLKETFIIFPSASIFLQNKNFRASNKEVPDLIFTHIYYIYI